MSKLKSFNRLFDSGVFFEVVPVKNKTPQTTFLVKEGYKVFIKLPFDGEYYECDQFTIKGEGQISVQIKIGLVLRDHDVIKTEEIFSVWALIG